MREYEKHRLAYVHQPIDAIAIKPLTQRMRREIDRQQVERIRLALLTLRSAKKMAA